MFLMTMQFRDIIGCEQLKKQLIGSVSRGQVAHAQLFFGQPGSPMLLFAHAYAMLLNCLDPTPDGDSCGVCDSCHKIAKLEHPDVYFSFPVSTTKQFSSKPVSDNFLPQFRNFMLKQPFGNAQDWNDLFSGEGKALNISRQEARQIIDKLSLKPYQGRYKIMIIWLPEYMNKEAANALLKVLEEPPAQTVFLMVSANRNALLATIQSRLQSVYIPLLEDAQVVDYLVSIGVAALSARQAAAVSGGDVHYAMQLAGQQSNDYFDLFAQWMRACYAYDLLYLLGKCAESFGAFSRQDQKNFLVYAQFMMRQSMMILAGSGALSKAGNTEIMFLEKFAKVLFLQPVYHIIDLLDQAILHLERNANAKIIFADVCIQLCKTYHSSKLQLLK